MNCKFISVIFLSALASGLRGADGGPEFLDLSRDFSKDTVVAAGTAELYQGHPTTVQLPGTETVLCVWCVPHGGHAGQLARSEDGGRTWTRQDGLLPPGMSNHWNCPSIYRIVGPDGKARIFVFSAYLGNDRQRFANAMPAIVSEDDGLSWRELPPLGAAFRCVMTFTSMVPLKDGRTMAFFHRGPADGRDRHPLEVLATVTADGGFSWSEPRVVCRVEGKSPCEAFALRSDDGDELCLIMRENTRTGHSLMTTSRDEGQTWTPARETAWALTGDRHAGIRLPDGRWLIAFRDTAPKSPTKGHFIAWLGTYADIIAGRPGLRLKLLHNYDGWDCGYPGVSLLPDGHVLAVTYVKYHDGPERQSVVACRLVPPPPQR